MKTAPLVLGALAAASVAIFMSPQRAYSAPHNAPSSEGSSSKTLQLAPLIAPAQSRPGSFTTAMHAMTPILVVPMAKNSPLVCQRAPRVSEALLRYFMKNPAPVDKTRHLDVDSLTKQSVAMAAFVNTSIGMNAVSNVYVIEGNKALTTGVAARLPFSTATACGSVLDAYEKQVQEILKN